LALPKTKIFDIDLHLQGVAKKKSKNYKNYKGIRETVDLERFETLNHEYSYIK